MTFEQADKLFGLNSTEPVYVWSGGSKLGVSGLKKAMTCGRDYHWYFEVFEVDGRSSEFVMPIASCQLEFKSLWSVCEKFLHEKDMDKLTALLAIHATDLEKVPFRGGLF